MEVSQIIAEIDTQILNLQKARALLADSSVAAVAKVPSRRGRPKGSKNVASKKTAKVVAPVATTKRKLSPEGRKAIADAMKKRWAEKRKQVAK